MVAYILLPSLINVHTQEDNVNMHEYFVEMQFTDQFRHCSKLFYLLTYANDIVPHTCKIQHTYVGMRLHSVNMRLIYVDMQVNYVKMQDMYVQMQEHYVNMRPNDISIQYNFNMFKGSILE